MTLKYYSGNRIAGTANDRGSLATTNLLPFTNFHETDTDDVYTWDGDSWNIVASNTGAETLANKTLTAPTVNAGTLNLMTAFTVANDIDVGAYEVKALKFESDQATGTAPLTVTSTTVVANLNADKLDGVEGALYSQIAATETLLLKTLTAPKFADGGFIADPSGNEILIFNIPDSAATAVNEITIESVIADGSPSIKATGGDTDIDLILSGKGAGGVRVTGVASGAFLEFDTKATPADPSTEQARMYLKNSDTDNNVIAVKIQKAGVIQEVEITSPKAVCAVCGSTDGAKDPTYDFARSVMVLDLWCGHSFEVPMQWSQINGDS